MVSFSCWAQVGIFNKRIVIVKLNEKKKKKKKRKKKRFNVKGDSIQNNKGY